MAKNCTTEKTARRQEWIENGLLELMGSQTFDSLTVTDLCAHLGLSRRSFYRYFRDLEDVLDSALNHTFQRMAMPGGPPDMQEIRKNYEFWLQNRHILDALNHSGMIDRLFEYIHRYTEPMTIDGLLAPDDLNMDIRKEASTFATSGSVAMVLAWYADGFRKTPEQMAAITYRLLFSPILEKE